VFVYQTYCVTDCVKIYNLILSYLDYLRQDSWLTICQLDIACILIVMKEIDISD
jgi:hypothetical protein